MSLKYDIGLDSLEIFELCTAIEKNYSVNIESRINENTTVGDIISFINCGITNIDKNNDTIGYPIDKTEKDN